MTRGTRETERFTLRGTLAACVVDGVVGVVLPGHGSSLGDGHKGVALLNERGQDGWQGLRRVLGGVVEQNDGAGLDLSGDPLGDLLAGALPVQAVHIPLDGFHTQGAHGVDDMIVILP